MRPLDDPVLVELRRLRLVVEELLLTVRGQSGRESHGDRSRKLLTVAEAAERCGYSRSHLHNAIQRGELPVVRLGRTARIPEEWLDRWIADQVSAWEAAKGVGARV